MHTLTLAAGQGEGRVPEGGGQRLRGQLDGGWRDRCGGGLAGLPRPHHERRPRVGARMPVPLRHAERNLWCRVDCYVCGKSARRISGTCTAGWLLCEHPLAYSGPTLTHAVGLWCSYVSPAAYQPDAALAYDRLLEVRCCT